MYINKKKNISNAEWLSHGQSLFQILIATQRRLQLLLILEIQKNLGISFYSKYLENNQEIDYFYYYYFLQISRK